MILRKPYAFLIRYFRLIHIAITIMLILITLRFRKVSEFLSICINNISYKYEASDYIKYGVFIWFIIALGLFIIIYGLFKYKNKPRKIYIFSIIGYIIIGFILILTYNYIGSFNFKIIDQKAIRLYRDILFICNIFQYLIIIIMFVRALGFNIKKFNFDKDVQDLNLTKEDNEEIEINIGFDMTNVSRNFRKQKRELKYFYQEFKTYILVILAVIVFFILFKGYQFYKKNYKVYNQGDYVGFNNYININDSYYSINDDDFAYIIVKFDIYNKSNKNVLNTGNMVLNVGNDRYYPNKSICYKFKKYGNCYKQQYITNQEKSYILVYKVEKLNINKSYIIYNDSYDKKYKIKLSINNVDE